MKNMRKTIQPSVQAYAGTGGCNKKFARRAQLSPAARNGSRDVIVLSIT